MRWVPSMLSCKCIESIFVLLCKSWMFVVAKQPVLLLRAMLCVFEIMFAFQRVPEESVFL